MLHFNLENYKHRDFDPFKDGFLLNYIIPEVYFKCTVAEKMIKKIKECGYCTLGSVLKDSSEAEIIELMKVLSDPSNLNERLVFIYLCRQGEGYADFDDSVAVIKDLHEFISIICVLIWQLRAVGWDINYNNVSLFDTDKFVFKNFTLQSFKGKTFGMICEMLNKEIF